MAAEEQFITYTEFLPATGVTLAPYAGYNPNVDTELSDEFATVGYRAHSMVDGEEQVEVKASKFDSSKLAALEAQGISSAPGPKKTLTLTIPQAAGFYNPGLIQSIGLAPILKGLTDSPGYANDEQIDDALRSILFEMPGAGTEPASCFQEAAAPGCFSAVEDLGAIDIQRARDNGIPAYNELREAVGLAPQHTFTEVTGESTEQFPTDDPLIPPSNAIENPHILDVTSLKNFYGEPVVPGLQGTGGQRDPQDHPGRAPEGHLRLRRQPRCVRGHDVRAAPRRQRARRTAVGAVAQTVRSAARRRPLLLRKPTRCCTKSP